MPCCYFAECSLPWFACLVLLLSVVTGSGWAISHPWRPHIRFALHAPCEGMLANQLSSQAAGLTRGAAMKTRRDSACARPAPRTIAGGARHERSSSLSSGISARHRLTRSTCTRAPRATARPTGCQCGCKVRAGAPFADDAGRRIWPGARSRGSRACA